MNLLFCSDEGAQKPPRIYNQIQKKIQKKVSVNFSRGVS